MNTRIQVEHTVTEMVTGLDLVREQVLIAAGEPLSLRQEDVRLSRARDRVPDQRRGRRATASVRRPGRITAYREPAGPGVRVDSGVVAGSEISPLYDPMIAKLIVHGRDREHARRRMLRALDEFVIEGPPTLIGFHKALLSHPCFVEGETCHGLVESELLARARGAVVSYDKQRSRRRRTAHGPSPGERARVEVDGRRFDVTAARAGAAVGGAGAARAASAPRRRSGGGGREALTSPMQGTVLAVEVAEATRSRPASSSASSRR